MRAAFLMVSLTSGLLQSACTRQTGVSEAPTGDASSIALQCGKVAFAIAMFLDPPRDAPWPGISVGNIPDFEESSRKHDNLASSALIRHDAVFKATAEWSTQVDRAHPGHGDDAVIAETLSTDGWSSPQKPLQTPKGVWPALERRLNWCVDHYELNLYPSPAVSETGEKPTAVESPAERSGAAKAVAPASHALPGTPPFLLEVQPEN